MVQTIWMAQLRPPHIQAGRWCRDLLVLWLPKISLRSSLSCPNHSLPICRGPPLRAVSFCRVGGHQHPGSRGAQLFVLPSLAEWLTRGRGDRHTADSAPGQRTGAGAGAEESQSLGSTCGCHQDQGHPGRKLLEREDPKVIAHLIRDDGGRKGKHNTASEQISVPNLGGAQAPHEDTEPRHKQAESIRFIISPAGGAGA